VDFDFSLYLDPASYLPVGLLDWTLQIVPIAFGIWPERSQQRLARGAYLGALILRVVGLLVLHLALTLIVLKVIFTHDPSSAEPMLFDANTLIGIGIFMSVLSGIVLSRPLVQRLRDAGIDPRWAYLAVLPYLDFLMFAGLIFYPPSKTALETSATVAAQT
jgi:uncharacterized membrane protein YhaH (DUF805 family)